MDFPFYLTQINENWIISEHEHASIKKWVNNILFNKRSSEKKF